MKNQWIGCMVLAAALALGACAPTQQGADATPAEATSSGPAHSIPMDSPSVAPSEDADGIPDATDYDYDY